MTGRVLAPNLLNHSVGAGKPRPYTGVAYTFKDRRRATLTTIHRSSGHGVFYVRPGVRRMEAQHDIAFWDARLFQTFGDSQIGVVGLKPGFPVDDLQTDYRPVNAPRPVPTFPQNLEGRRSRHRA